MKIVLIETENHFCYAIISKHGHVGLYDGNMEFLTSYHAIMTREDIFVKDVERRRRNRWITNATFCKDTLMLIITNSARSIIVYDASGLKHAPLWLILSVPNAIQVKISFFYSFLIFYGKFYANEFTLKLTFFKCIVSEYFVLLQW